MRGPEEMWRGGRIDGEKGEGTGNEGDDVMSCCKHFYQEIALPSPIRYSRDQVMAHQTRTKIFREHSFVCKHHGNGTEFKHVLYFTDYELLPFT
jgi:hypothetical protein